MASNRIQTQFLLVDSQALELSVRAELGARDGVHAPAPISIPIRLTHTLRSLGAAHTAHLGEALRAILSAYHAERDDDADTCAVVARNVVLFLSTIAVLDLASASAGTATPACELIALQQLAIGRLRALLSTTDVFAWRAMSCLGGRSEADLLVLVIGSISAFRLQSIASELLRVLGGCANGDILAPSRERQLLCAAIGALQMLPGSELQHVYASELLRLCPAADVVGALSRVLSQRRLGVLKHPIAHAICTLLLPLADSSSPPARPSGADWRVDLAWRVPLGVLAEKASAWLRKRKHRHVGARLLACTLCVADAQLFWTNFALAQSRLIEAVVEAEDIAVRTELHTAMRALLGRYLRLVATGREPLAFAAAGTPVAMLAPSHVFLLLQRLCVHAALRNHATTAALLGVPPVGREKPLATPVKAGASAGRPALRAYDGNVTCGLDLTLDEPLGSARKLGHGAHVRVPAASALEAELAARAALLAAVGEARPDFFAQGVALPCLHANTPLPLDVIAVLLSALASLLDGEGHADVSCTQRQETLDALFHELPPAASAGAPPDCERTLASEALRAWLPAVGAALAKAWVRLELPTSGDVGDVAIPHALASAASSTATSASTPIASPWRRALPADSTLNSATVGRCCLAALLRLTAHCWPTDVPHSAVCRVLCEAALSDQRVLVDGASRALRAWLDDASRAPRRAVAVAPSEAVRAFVQLCERSDADCLADSDGEAHCQHAARSLCALLEAAVERKLSLSIRALCEAAVCAVDCLVLDLEETRAIALRVLRAVRAGHAQTEGVLGPAGYPPAGLSLVLAELVGAVEQLELRDKVGAAPTQAAALRVVVVLARALACSHDGADGLTSYVPAAEIAADSDDDGERERAVEPSKWLARIAWQFAFGRFSRLNALHTQIEVSPRHDALRARWQARASSLCTLAGVGFALGGAEAHGARRAVRALFTAAATSHGAAAAHGALAALAHLPLSEGTLHTTLVEASWLLAPPCERAELARSGAGSAHDECAAFDVAPAAMLSPHGALALLLPSWQSSASAVPKRAPWQRELIAASAMRSRLLALADAIGRTLCSMLSQQVGTCGDGGLVPNVTEMEGREAGFAGKLARSNVQLGALAVVFAERVMLLIEAQADALAPTPPAAQPHDPRFTLGSRGAHTLIATTDGVKTDAAALALGLPALSTALCALVSSTLTPLLCSSAQSGLDVMSPAAAACAEATATATRRALQRAWPRVWQLLLGEYGSHERTAAGAASAGAAPWMTMPTPALALASAADAMCAVLREQGVSWLWPAVPPLHSLPRGVAMRLCSMPLAHEPELLRAGTELLCILARNSPADFARPLAEECHGAEPRAAAASFDALACIALESELSLRPLGDYEAASRSAAVLAAALWALGSPSPATRSRAVLVCAYAAGRPSADGRAPSAHQLHQLRLHTASERTAAAQALTADMLVCACPLQLPELVAVEALGRLGDLADSPPLRRRRECMLQCIHILVTAVATAAARKEPAVPSSPALLHALARLPAAVATRCGLDEGAVVGERAATLWLAIAKPLGSQTAALAVVLMAAVSTPWDDGVRCTLPRGLLRIGDDASVHVASEPSSLGAQPWLAAAVAVSSVNEVMTCALLCEVLSKDAICAADAVNVETSGSLFERAEQSVGALSTDLPLSMRLSALDSTPEDEAWLLASCREQALALAARATLDRSELDVSANAALELPPSPPPSPPLLEGSCFWVPSPPSRYLKVSSELLSNPASSPLSSAPSPQPLDVEWQTLLDDFPLPPTELPPPPPVSALTHLTLDRPSPARFARRNMTATEPSVAAPSAAAPRTVDAAVQNAVDLEALGAIVRREAAACCEAAARAEMAAHVEAAARAETAARSSARATELAAHHLHMAAVARGQTNDSPPASGNRASRSPLSPLAAFEVNSSSHTPTHVSASVATAATRAAASDATSGARAHFARPSKLCVRSAYELPEGLLLPPAGRALCASVEILSNKSREWALARPELSARVLWAAVDQALNARSGEAREAATQSLVGLTLIFEVRSDPSFAQTTLSRLVALVSERAARSKSADLVLSRSRAAEVHAELKSAVDSLARSLVALFHASGQPEGDALCGSFEHVATQMALASAPLGETQFSHVSPSSIRHELLCALSRSRPLQLLPDDDAMARRCERAQALLHAAGEVASECGTEQLQHAHTSPVPGGQIELRLQWCARLVETARELLALTLIDNEGDRVALSEPSAASLGRAHCSALHVSALALELHGSPASWEAAAWLIADTLGVSDAHTSDERAAAAPSELGASDDDADRRATGASLRGVGDWMSSNCGRLLLALMRGLSDERTRPAAASALRSLWAWLPPLHSEAALILPGIPAALVLTRALGMSERSSARSDQASSSQAGGRWHASFELRAYLRRSGAQLGAGALDFDMRRALCALGGDADGLAPDAPATKSDADRVWARSLAALCGADGPEHALTAVAALLQGADEPNNIAPVARSLCGAALELSCAMLAERAAAPERCCEATPRGTGAAALWNALLGLRADSRLAHASVVNELVQLIAQADVVIAA